MYEINGWFFGEPMKLLNEIKRESGFDWFDGYFGGLWLYWATNTHNTHKRFCVTRYDTYPLALSCLFVKTKCKWPSPILVCLDLNFLHSWVRILLEYLCFLPISWHSTISYSLIEWDRVFSITFSCSSSHNVIRGQLSSRLAIVVCCASLTSTFLMQRYSWYDTPVSCIPSQ